MREIKFRWWFPIEEGNKSLRQGMVYELDCQQFSDVNELFVPNNYVGNPIPMQFTGLLDKNGKEIYEGDIVKHPTGKMSVIEYIVQQRLPEKETEEISYDSPYDFSGFTGISYGGVIEVIGNIYENPNLLN